MSVIKTLRKKSGFTQSDLSKKTGLSLRTIQRLEADNKEPEGFSLLKVSEAFELEPLELREMFNSQHVDKDADMTSISIINLSVLSFLIIPFGNIIFPVILWRKWKAKAKTIDITGRRIISVQIIYTAIQSILLCISGVFENGILPPILVVLFTAMSINILVVFYTAFRLKQKGHDVLNLPIQLL